MSSAAKFAGPISNAYYADDIAVLLSEESHRADLFCLRLTHLFRCNLKVLDQKRINAGFDIIENTDWNGAIGRKIKTEATWCIL